MLRHIAVNLVLLTAIGCGLALADGDINDAEIDELLLSDAKDFINPENIHTLLLTESEVIQSRTPARDVRI